MHYLIMILPWMIVLPIVLTGAMLYIQRSTGTTTSTKVGDKFTKAQQERDAIINHLIKELENKRG